MHFIDTFFKHFPTPRYMAMPHVGVDISTTAIRYVELNKTTEGLKLGRFGTQSIPTPLIYSEPLASNKDLVDALKKIQRANRFNFVEVSIPEERAYLFTMEIPDADKETIRNHIEFHLEENVPVALAEAVFDYHVVGHTGATSVSGANDATSEKGTDKNSGKKGVSLASVSVVPREVIEDYISLFEKSGMTPISFLIENQALTKSIIKQSDMSSYLVVNIGQRKTVLSIVSDQTVQFTSTVNIGGDDLTNALAKEYNISKEEAEIMKSQKAFIRNNDNTVLFMSLVNVVSALRDEVQRVCMYWLSHTESASLKILLAGRDSSIIGFREYMALSLKLPVESANVWTNVLSFENEIPPIEYLDSLNYGTVIGLALPKASSQQ